MYKTAITQGIERVLKAWKRILEYKRRVGVHSLNRCRATGTADTFIDSILPKFHAVTSSYVAVIR